MADFINILDDDILQTIFQQCAVELEDSNKIEFSQVSTRWRRLAIATPQLWTNILIKNPNHVKLWLKRSRNRPLRIKFVKQINDGTVYKPFLVTLAFLYAVKHIARWMDVEFDMAACLLLMGDALMKLENTIAPQLQSFSIKPGIALYSDIDRITPVLLRFLSHSGSYPLRLQISGQYFPPVEDFAVWSRLSELHLTNLQRPFTVDTCIKLISKCTSAKEIKISSHELGFTHRAEAHKIVKLPMLQKLTIGLRVEIKSILECFELPHLEQLIIKYNYATLTREVIDEARRMRRTNLFPPSNGGILRDINAYVPLVGHVPELIICVPIMSLETPGVIAVLVGLDNRIPEQIRWKFGVLDPTSKIGWRRPEPGVVPETPSRVTFFRDPIIWKSYLWIRERYWQ